MRVGAGHMFTAFWNLLLFCSESHPYRVLPHPTVVSKFCLGWRLSGAEGEGAENGKETTVKGSDPEATKDGSDNEVPKDGPQPTEAPAGDSSPTAQKGSSRMEKPIMPTLVALGLAFL
ncbi:unnamed protein product [Strongylus vulgaris]|uniref:Uncharacterized protein n=1 Tax=Strongylus vulgaris TaxID=40348 RepID=A0A3P7IY00_STRVU|nr:unnamed protein product [Strongylus vulgaris]